MRSSSPRLAIVVVFGGLAVLGAQGCSSTTTTTTTAGDKTDPAPESPKAETDAGASDPAPAAPEKDASTPPANKGECASSTGQQDCMQCCSTAHENGSTTYFVALFDCICTVDHCKTDCGPTLCNDANPTQPDAACNTCMQAKNAECQVPVADACAADPDCIAFDKCVSASGCASK